MSSCCCSLAGTAACRYCSNNPYAESPPTVCTVKTTTEMPADYPFFKPREEKPRTNADRFRASTDEELAWIFATLDEWTQEAPANLDNEGVYQFWLNWLKQEVE